MKKLLAFFLLSTGALAGFLLAAFGAAFGAAPFFDPSAPMLNLPIPPCFTGFGPLSPPIPIALPCSLLTVGPDVIGMKADACEASRITATTHLRKADEENMVAAGERALFTY